MVIDVSFIVDFVLFRVHDDDVKVMQNDVVMMIVSDKAFLQLSLLPLSASSQSSIRHHRSSR